MAITNNKHIERLVEETIRRSVVPNQATSLLFLGVGQSGSMISHIDQAMPSPSAVVSAAPYFSLESADDIELLGKTLVAKVIKQTNVQSGNFDVYTESQAAPAVVKTLVGTDIPTPRRIILITPLGLNHAALGENDSQRYKELMRRSTKFWTHRDQSLRHKANRNTFKNVLRERILRPRYFKQAYIVGVNQNIASELETLAGQVEVHIFAGDNDSLFPYDEIATTIQRVANVTLHHLRDTTHINRATPKGLQQLESICKKIETKG